MNILFVYPNKDTFGYKPVGIALLSALLKRDGHKVALFDTTFFDLGVEEYTGYNVAIKKYKPVDFSGHNVAKVKVDLGAEVRKTLDAFKPDLAGVSLTQDEDEVSTAICRFIKEHRPDLPIAWGGAHPTVDPADCIGRPYVDFCCVGEGIEAVPELIRALESGGDVTNIPNIWAKRDGTVFENPMRPLYRDMDALPYLDWDVFDPRQFLKPFDGRITRCADFMAVHGCPHRCSYCINSWLFTHTKGLVRGLSPRRAVDELKFHIERHGVDFVRFPDEDFLMRPKKVFFEFAELYAREVGLPFTCKTHPRSVSVEKVEALKAMNIAGVSIGVESGNEFIRREVLGRIETPDEIRRAFAIFNDAKIRTGSYIMLGLPYEDREKIFDTIELLRDIKPTVVEFGFFFPFKGSTLYDVCMKEGFYDPTEVPTFQWHYPTLKLPTISREELKGLYRCFNLYCKMPKSFYKLIERAEKDDPVGDELFKLLVEVYAEHYFD